MTELSGLHRLLGRAAFARRLGMAFFACALMAALAALGAPEKALAADPADKPESVTAEKTGPATPAESLDNEPKKPATFAQWMAKAEQGDPEAQCNVGVFYVNGDSVPQNFPLGIKWLSHAADQGFSYAQYVMAGLYTRGVGDMPPDTLKAYFWASLSAAATDLPEKYLRKAAKIRDANRDRLTVEQLRQAQDMTRQWWEKHPPSS